MSLLKRERAVEIQVSSGTLRVTVTPRPAWLMMAIEAVVIVVVGGMFLRSWTSVALWVRGIVVWAFASAIGALLYQSSGSETIELDSQKLVIAKSIFGWSRTREYAVTDCHDLEWREAQGEGDNEGLQCKVGWRTIRFGKYISEDEAIEILTALQTNLPDAAHQMLSSKGDMKQHLTTLNLS